MEFKKTKDFFKLQTERVYRMTLFLFSILIKCFVKVKKNRIICWSFNYNQYACNPKYITQYLLDNYENEYEIYWVFEKNVDISNIDKRIRIIYYKSFQYFIIINSSQFVITNCRANPFKTFWTKRKNQKYVMTWHSSMGIKRIEKDAEKQLSKRNIKVCKHDSSQCDLILSGCEFRTNVIKRAFWYDGEILKKGTPRNDILFSNPQATKHYICKKYGINENDSLLLYAPTFRHDLNIDNYDVDWQKILPIIKEKWKKNFIILYRLHPAYADRMKQINFNVSEIVDVTCYLDMQELLLASDILITDYSSSMFDFMLMKKKCFLYVKDYMTFDRGYYFKLEDLPFPIAYNNEILLNNINLFNEEDYLEKLHLFESEKVHSYETGNASYYFVEWLKKEQV
jgi:CDP-glycerol glycerophosphotransferase